jgi:hypothetical protein
MLAERLQRRLHDESYRSAVDVQSGAFATGNPASVIKVLAKYREAGVDQIQQRQRERERHLAPGHHLVS